MGFVQEFKEFAMKGNVIDMAVGIVIGGAFTKIVNSLVSDVIMPVLSPLMSQAGEIAKMGITLREKIGEQDAIVLRWGAFVDNVLSFVIVAFAVFVVIKQMNKLKEITTKVAGS